MNKNTIEEKELLESLFVIEQLLEDKRNNVHRFTTQEDRTNLERVLEKAREAYPHVREFYKSLDCCKERFLDFLSDMIPVFDRLKSQEESEVEALNNQLLVDSANATEETVDAVINQYNKDLDNFNSQISEKLDIVIEGMKEVEEPKETKATAKRVRKSKGK